MIARIYRAFNFSWVISSGVVALVMLYFLMSTAILIEPHPEYVDSLDNLKLAYNLAKYGKFSADNINNDLATKEGDTLSLFLPGSGKVVRPDEARLTAIREPLPVYLNSWIINAVDLLKKQANVQQLNNGRAVFLIKLQNIFWTFLIFLALTVIVKKIFPQSAVMYCAFSWLLIGMTFHYLSPRMYAWLLTEIVAAALMLWFLIFKLVALRTNRKLFFVISGALYGALILTKAAFLYIGLVFFLALFGWLIYVRRQFDHVKNFGWMMLVCILVVSPWMVRNKLTLDFFGITSRASDVLMVRAEKNNMTSLEMKGAISYYAPTWMQKPISRYFGFNLEDLKPNGRLARIVRGHPQDKLARSQLDVDSTISYYYRGTTKALKARMEAYNSQASILAADRKISQEAIKMMLDQPLKHLKTTLIFAYRGLFVPKADIFTVIGFFATIGFLINGILKMNDTYVVLFLLPTLCFAFYAFFTHFIPRYSDPLIPFWMLGFVLLCAKFLQYLLHIFSYPSSKNLTY